MLVHFQLPDVIPQALKWSKPSKFAELHIPTDVVAAAFRCVPPLDKIDETHGSRHEMLDTHLSEWSRHVESAFNKAVVMHHQADPLRQMHKQLPKSCRGRCSQETKLQRVPQTCVAKASNRGYEPCAEALSTKARQKVRQVRRLESLNRQLKSLQRTGVLPTAQQNFQIATLWKSIFHAAGYGNEWYRWILGHECVFTLCLQAPTLEDLDLFHAITKHDADAFCKSEELRRNRTVKLVMQNDIKHGSYKLHHQMIKAEACPPLVEFPTQASCEYSLTRQLKGQLKLIVLPASGSGLGLSK